jgi:hypothetical protein
VDPLLTVGLAAAIAAVVAAVVGWRAARTVRDRYRHLLAAIEGTALQLAELRRAVDRLDERARTLDDRVAALEPQVARLGRALEIEQASQSVRSAELTARLAPEPARALLRHLAELADAVAGSRGGG